MKRSSTAWPLLLAYTCLVLYASLYPFLDWRDKGIVPWAFLSLPAPRLVWSSFDNVVNVLGYLPFGLLMALALLRSHGGVANPRLSRAVLVVLTVTLTGSSMSLAMECLQSYLPSRYPSKLDWGTNTLGSLIGASIASLVERFGLLTKWALVRQRWFVSNAYWGIGLLALWPAALLYPTAVPLGLGHVVERIDMWAASQWPMLIGWLNGGRGVAPELRPLSAGSELLCVMLGLLAPALFSHVLIVSPLRRTVALVFLVFAGWAVTTLSSALSFGPANAWSWWSLQAQLGIVAGSVVALAAVRLSARTSAALALLAFAFQLSTLNHATVSAYFWQTLQTWEQGRFIQFHGVTQWLGWIWPFATMAWLLTRVSRRGT